MGMEELEPRDTPPFTLAEVIELLEESQKDCYVPTEKWTLVDEAIGMLKVMKGID